MSPAMTPDRPMRSWASRPAAPCTATPQPAANSRRAARRQQGADHAGQHVAAAGRRQAGRGHVRTQHGAVRTGDHGVGPLEHHHLAPLRWPPRTRPPRGHRRRPTARRRGCARAGARTHRGAGSAPPAPTAVATTASRWPAHSGRRHRSPAGWRSSCRKPRTRRCVAGWRPSPGPTTSASKERASVATRRQPAGPIRPGASSSSSMAVSSGAAPSRRAPTDSGVARQTTPAPARAAPAARQQGSARRTPWSRPPPAAARTCPCARALGEAAGARRPRLTSAR